MAVTQEQIDAYGNLAQQGVQLFGTLAAQARQGKLDKQREALNRQLAIDKQKSDALLAAQEQRNRLANELAQANKSTSGKSGGVSSGAVVGMVVVGLLLTGAVIYVVKNKVFSK